MSAPPLVITASPHVAAGDTTPRIMWHVAGSLVPVVGAAAVFFGPSAVLVVGTATAACWLTERLLGPRGSLRDGSATITGLLLGLACPPGLPLWMVAVGGAFAIAIGKLVFGGLGQNVFNPALLGRAFLQAAFPVAMTTWPLPVAERWWALRGDTFAIPFTRPVLPDGITGATPLGRLKFEQQATPLLDLVVGTTGGSVGETAGLLILACGGYLALRNFLNWRIPASIFLTVAAVAGTLHRLDPRYPDALFMLFSGGLVLGAVYMATDMVTSPVTNPGCWAFGAGIGVLVVVIRIWGGLAEGVMYAILIMNAFVPFLNRWTEPRRFGVHRMRIGR